MTSFKAGQLIIDKGYADNVVFLVDRKALDSQSKQEYNSFAPIGRKVVETKSAFNLFDKRGGLIPRSLLRNKLFQNVDEVIY